MTDGRIEELHADFLKDAEYRKAYAAEDLIHRVAARVNEIRHIRDLTQTELADRLDTKQPRVAALEGGYENITLRTLSEISYALECRPEDLVNREMPAVLAGNVTWEVPNFLLRVELDPEELRSAEATSDSGIQEAA